MKTIYDFKIGDEIVRITPAKPLENGILGGIRDRSYLGERMIFKGIANGHIYLKRMEEFQKRLFGNKLLDLPLDLWDKGWDKWVDPLTLLENEIDPIHIEDKLLYALSEEDYELAEKLKNMLHTKYKKNNGKPNKKHKRK